MRLECVFRLTLHTHLPLCLLSLPVVTSDYGTCHSCLESWLSSESWKRLPYLSLQEMWLYHQRSCSIHKIHNEINTGLRCSPLIRSPGLNSKLIASFISHVAPRRISSVTELVVQNICPGVRAGLVQDREDRWRMRVDKMATRQPEVFPGKLLHCCCYNPMVLIRGSFCISIVNTYFHFTHWICIWKDQV